MVGVARGEDARDCGKFQGIFFLGFLKFLMFFKNPCGRGQAAMTSLWAWSTSGLCDVMVGVAMVGPQGIVGNFRGNFLENFSFLIFFLNF